MYSIEQTKSLLRRAFSDEITSVELENAITPEDAFDSGIIHILLKEAEWLVPASWMFYPKCRSMVQPSVALLAAFTDTLHKIDPRILTSEHVLCEKTGSSSVELTPVGLCAARGTLQFLPNEGLRRLSSEYLLRLYVIAARARTEQLLPEAVRSACAMQGAATFYARKLVAVGRFDLVPEAQKRRALECQICDFEHPRAISLSTPLLPGEALYYRNDQPAVARLIDSNPPYGVMLDENDQEIVGALLFTPESEFNIDESNMKALTRIARFLPIECVARYYNDLRSFIEEYNADIAVNKPLQKWCVQLAQHYVRRQTRSNAIMRA